jgi:hypothetical protein
MDDYLIKLVRMEDLAKVLERVVSTEKTNPSAVTEKH